MNIFLIGFMGSGKTTVGKKIANKLNYQFIDSDESIENEEGMTIQEIFTQKGEVYFRKKEHDFLVQLNTKNSVISLGGGTPCFYENMQIISQKGISIYLMIPIDTVIKRLLDSNSKRPLIEKLKDNPIELKKSMELLFKNRESIYKKASIHIDAFNLNSTKINSLIQLIQSS